MPLQTHIHISTTLSGSPEFSPDKTWTAQKVKPTSVVFMSLGRSLTGHLHYQILSDDSGNVLRFMNYEYKIRVATWSDVETMLSLLGQPVYFIPHVHADDGTDHTNDILDMVLARVANIDAIDSRGYRHWTFDITLMDDYTVS